MKRGDVYWADLVLRSGSEQTGRRPVIVMSHDGFNQTPGRKSIRCQSEPLREVEEGLKAAMDLD
jgi:mRNA-degrading endonuclease toxin of MazEF toxin-antitoxin module